MNNTFIILDGYRKGLSPLAAAAPGLLGGWFLAFAVRIVLTRTLKWMRFESISARMGFTEFLRKGSAHYTPVQLIGVLAYWIVLAVTFIGVSKILDLAIVQELSRQIQLLLPSVIAALFILIIGIVLISFLANFVRTLVLNAAIPHAQVISTLIKYIGIAVVIVVALDQVGFGKTILAPMILMLFGALVFGVALAFGLGCKDIARSAMEQFLRELREREQGPKGTDLEG